MLHTKVFIPVLNPVTEVVGELTAEIVPVPAIKDQVPVPVLAEFA